MLAHKTTETQQKQSGCQNSLSDKGNNEVPRPLSKMNRITILHTFTCHVIDKGFVIN